MDKRRKENIFYAAVLVFGLMLALLVAGGNRVSEENNNLADSSSPVFDLFRDTCDVCGSSDELSHCYLFDEELHVAGTKTYCLDCYARHVLDYVQPKGIKD